MWVVESGSIVCNLQESGNSAAPPFSSPLRLYFHRADLGRRVVLEAAPLPFSWFFDQSAFHGIAMDVAQPLNEARMATYVVVVIALLPERGATLGVVELIPPSDRNLQGLNGTC
jgi:hypothetical protein